jgi:hypothetical protein
MNKTTIRQMTASTLMWLAATVVAGFASAVASAQGAPIKLESIDVQTLTGQQMQLTLHHSGPPAEPVAFTIDNPARISLDLANTRSRCLPAASTCARVVWIPCWPLKPPAGPAWF